MASWTGCAVYPPSPLADCGGVNGTRFLGETFCGSHVRVLLGGEARAELGGDARETLGGDVGLPTSATACSACCVCWCCTCLACAAELASGGAELDARNSCGKSCGLIILTPPAGASYTKNMQPQSCSTEVVAKPSICAGCQHCLVIEKLSTGPVSGMKPAGSCVPELCTIG